MNNWNVDWSSHKAAIDFCDYSGVFYSFLSAINERIHAVGNFGVWSSQTNVSGLWFFQYPGGENFANLNQVPTILNPPVGDFFFDTLDKNLPSGYTQSNLWLYPISSPIVAGGDIGLIENLWKTPNDPLVVPVTYKATDTKTYSSYPFLASYGIDWYYGIYGITASRLSQVADKNDNNWYKYRDSLYYWRSLQTTVTNLAASYIKNIYDVNNLSSKINSFDKYNSFIETWANYGGGFPPPSGFRRKYPKEIFTIQDIGIEGQRARFFVLSRQSKYLRFGALNSNPYVNWYDDQSRYNFDFYLKVVTNNPDQSGYIDAGRVGFVTPFNELRYSGHYFEYSSASGWLLSDDQISPPDLVETYGSIQDGDYFGSWILEDLQTAINLMTCTFSTPVCFKDANYVFTPPQQVYSLLPLCSGGLHTQYANGNGAFRFFIPSGMNPSFFTALDDGDTKYFAGNNAAYSPNGFPVLSGSYALAWGNKGTNTWTSPAKGALAETSIQSQYSSVLSSTVDLANASGSYVAGQLRRPGFINFSMNFHQEVFPQTQDDFAYWIFKRAGSFVASGIPTLSGYNKHIDYYVWPQFLSEVLKENGFPQFKEGSNVLTSNTGIYARTLPSGSIVTCSYNDDGMGLTKNSWNLLYSQDINDSTSNHIISTPWFPQYPSGMVLTDYVGVPSTNSAKIVGMEWGSAIAIINWDVPGGFRYTFSTPSGSFPSGTIFD